MAHVQAITTEKAGGERFLVTSGEFFRLFPRFVFIRVSFSGPFTFQGVLDEIHTESASDPLLLSIPKGTAGAGKNVTHPVLIDTTKARTVLGMKFMEISETAKDTARSLLEREKSCGW